MCQLCEALGYNLHFGEAAPAAVMSIGASWHYAGATQISYQAPVLSDAFAAATAVGVAPSGNPVIDAVVAGYGRWSGQVTYSFPSDALAYSNSYAVAIDGLVQVSAAQINAIRGILEGTGNIYGSVEAFCGLDLAQVADNTDRSNVNLQIAQCDNFGGVNLPTARVGDFPGSPIYPGFTDAAGDLWFGNDSGTGANDGGQVFRTPVIGNYAWMTHIHELGHALGLQHSHDSAAGSFGAALPADRRDIEFSVMSYLSFIGAAPGYTNEQFGFAQTFMMYDILALQYLYGADYSTNSGNTVYTWSASTGQMFVNGVGQGLPGANRIFLTIWDGNGNDTYDMSNYSNAVSIDLRPEMWSVTSTAQLADLDWRTSDPSRVAHGNVYNAALFNGDARSVIENAIGGTGDDTLIANDFGCTLIGGGGGDFLLGGAGIDRLVGGTGIDTMNGGGGADTFVFGFGDSSAAGGQHDQIYGFATGVDRIDLSAIDAIAATGTHDLFRFIGTAAFSGAAGELNYSYNSSLGVTVVQGDTNGDRVADFAIDLAGNVTLGVDDFIGALASMVVIEASGQTALIRNGNNFLLGGSGPTVKFGGGNVVPNQFGAWVPIGTEQTATGYQIVWKFGSADQYTIWTTDSGGNYITNSATMAGSDSRLTALESSFAQDLNGNGTIGAPITIIETSGQTWLKQNGANFFLSTGGGPNLIIKFGGGNVVPNQFGAWAPIAAEQTASGYQIVWKFGSADQYTIWTTDSNGNYITNSAVMNGFSVSAYESSFAQDLNGNVSIGTSVLMIEWAGQIQLTQTGNHFVIYDGFSRPTISYGGSNIVPNQFGAWTPIGVEQAAGGGYQIAWKFGSADQYNIWTTDSSGKHITNSAAMTGSEVSAFEVRFSQDLNADGTIGPVVSVIEAAGQTELNQSGNNFFLHTGASNLAIKFGGINVVPNRFGAWEPLGAEPTASGYQIVWKFGVADQYTIWTTDSSGNYITNSDVMTGSDPRLTSLENSFQQDLNNDGTISPAGAVIAGSGTTTMVQSTAALEGEKLAFDVARFFGESNLEGWHFKTAFQSGDADISAPEGLSLGSQLLTELLNVALASRQETFAIADGAFDVLVNHDGGIQTKTFAVDLQTSFLILH